MNLKLLISECRLSTSLTYQNLIKGILIVPMVFAAEMAFASNNVNDGAVANNNNLTTVLNVSQETITVDGQVVDENGRPISGATVILQGTSLGAITDVNGHFVIKTNKGAKLAVSFIGYNEQVVTVEGSSMVIKLQASDLALDDVVVVAYGTAKKESLTGAIVSVKSADIEKRPVTSVTSVLEGNATGVMVNNSYGEPGSDASIRIRGFGSLSSTNSPLIVLDGVPFGGNMSDINPADIASLSVLKDAASSALYGNRAANGVIMITTKKGSKERLNMRFTVNQGVYNRGIADYDKLDADDYMEVAWLGLRNSLVTGGASVADANAQTSATLIDSYLGYNIYNKSNSELFDSEGKLVSDAQVLSGYTDLDWYEPIERLGYRQDYNMSADGATEMSDYIFSVGYLDEKGYVTTSDYTRLTARTNVNIQPRKWIKAGLNTSASYQVSNSTTGSADDASSYTNPFMFAGGMAPIYPVYEHVMATGEFLLDENGDKIYDNGEANSRGQYAGRHVIWENELNMDRTYRTTVGGQSYIDINFANDFTFSVKGDISLRNSENRTYDNAIIGNGAGSGRAKRVQYRWLSYTMQQQLNWNRSFDKHNFDVLLGHENYSYTRNYQYGYKTGETLEGNMELVNFTEITSLTGYEDNYRLESYLSRVKYNYDDKYYAEASLRTDGSSRFSPDNRWGTFWSIGGSWILSREEFLKPYSKNINMLKLRASYGEVGDDSAVGYYGYMALYDLDQNGGSGAAYLSQSSATDIEWETSGSYGIALEGRFFQRLNASIEYFDKRTQDLLFDVNNPLSAGGTSLSSAESVTSQNIGSISNRGIELDFSYDVISRKDLRFNLGFNLTALTNEILRLPDENRENGIINGTKKYMEGHGIYDFWLYQYVGVDQMTGNSLYLVDHDSYYIDGVTENASGTAIPTDALVEIGGTYYTTQTTYAKKDWSGSAIPDVYGSISASLDYKNFSISALCTYSIGGKVIDYTYQDLMSVTSSPDAVHADVLNAWNGVPEGMTEDSANRIDPDGVPEVNYTNSQYNNALSTRFLLDGSYFIIKNVALSYNLPQGFCKKYDLSGISVSLSVDNLATFTSLKGMNPQQSFSGIVDNAFLPARVFSLGINVKL